MSILKRYLGGKAQEWIVSSGYPDEFTFWSSLSGLDQSTMHDHCNTYLSSLGHTGTLRDKLRQWGQTLTDGSGTIPDLLQTAAEAPISFVSVSAKQVAHWICDDNDTNTKVTDYSGNEYNGTASNWSSVLDSPGNSPSGTSCFDLNGTQYFDEADNADLRLGGSYSFSLWVSPNTTWSGSGSQRIIQKLPGEGFLLLFQNASSLLYYTSDGSADSITSDVTTFTGGQWYWLYVEWDGVTKKMYIDNSVQSNTSGNGATGSTSGTDLSIGHSSGSQILDGKIWDVRMFNDVLTSEERDFVYNGGVGTTAS